MRTNADGKSQLTPNEAKELVLGRQGTYATISFRRPEGPNVRVFKVQLMRGSADYIFLVECLRGLEHQLSDLQAENETLRNQQPPSRSFPTSQGANDKARLQELQAENDRLKEQHHHEIEDLLSRIEEIENRERWAKEGPRGEDPRVEMLKANLVELEDENNKLKATLERLAPENIQFRKDIKELKALLAQLEAENDELRKQQPEPEILKREKSKAQRSAAPPPRAPVPPAPEPEPEQVIPQRTPRAQRSAAPPSPQPLRSPVLFPVGRAPVPLSAPRLRDPYGSPNFYPSDGYTGGYYPSPPEAMFNRRAGEIPGSRERLMLHPRQVNGAFIGSPGGGANMRGDLE